MTPTTMVEAFEAAADRASDSVFLLNGDRSITYEQTRNGVSAASALLNNEGVSLGDRVMIILPNVPDFVQMLYGVWRLGAVAVPVSPLLKQREIAAILRDSGAKLLIAWFALAEDARAAAEQVGVPLIFATPPGARVPGRMLSNELNARYMPVQSRYVPPTSVAAFLYTSGTTGMPKGAMLSHRAILASAEIFRAQFQLGSEDRQIALLPLFHSFGLTAVLNATVLAGASLVLFPRFTPNEALDAICNHHVTVLSAVTAMHSALAMVAEERQMSPDVSSVRLAGAGASTFPPDVAERVSRIFGCPIMQGYGMTETCASATLTLPSEALSLGQIGNASPSMEVMIADKDGNSLPDGEIGEILIRGPTLMDGYYANATATAETILPSGWLRSGDLGFRDATGFRFVDRLKEVIKRGGLNVYPSEIESVLYEYPDVKLAAVIGIPDERLGEEVAAVVVGRATEPIDTDALREWVRARVASYKYPRRIVEVRELPLAPSGKILKRAIETTRLFPPIS